MVTKVQKWGNSLGLRLPKKLADDLHLGPGTEVDIAVVEGALVLTPVRGKKLSLSALLARVTPANRHGELPSGARRGREIW